MPPTRGNSSQETSTIFTTGLSILLIIDMYYVQDPLEKGMATHSSILEWTIPWAEEPVHGVTKSQT